MLLLAETLSVSGFLSALWKFFIGLFGFALEHPFISLLFILIVVGLSKVKFYGDHSGDFVGD